MADALSSVKGPVRAEPIVHYTIKSTVNRHTDDNQGDPIMWPQFAADQATYDATLATDLAGIPPGRARLGTAVGRAVAQYYHGK